MIKYSINTPSDNSKYIQIEITKKLNGNNEIFLQLPSWRPGRYEIGNFAQNIRKVHVHSLEKSIGFEKVKKDLWRIETEGLKEISITYEYYAGQLDAGNTWYDNEQLYVNPVTCLPFFLGEENEKCEILIKGIPESNKIASSLKFNAEKSAQCDTYHELADSPFIASGKLEHEIYSIGEYVFNIWIIGTCKPDWERIKLDFWKFSKTQIDMFGSLPVKEYHFLFELVDTKFHHGVEHLASTVICLGPGFNLMKKEVYDDFLGVSSHELFHSWNIKSIRPVELMPYRYDQENYSKLFYVAEGVTTYYGDLMLLRSEAYDWETFASEFSRTVTQHFHNGGRLHQSVADASFDSWLDGYKPGVPNRKVSFYVTGSLIAFILDIKIRKDTGSHESLDSVMRILYDEFGKKGKGYSENDYIEIIQRITQKDYRPFFEENVWSVNNLENLLQESLAFIGCYYSLVKSKWQSERHFGFKIKEDVNKVIVQTIAPGSPAEEYGLLVNDEIIAVNGIQVDKNFDDLLIYNEEKPVLTIFRNRKLVEIQIEKSKYEFYSFYQVMKFTEAQAEQRESYSAWAGVEF